MRLTAGLQHFWTAVWPNLAANVVWIPVVWVHHQWMRRRVNVLHDTIHELRALLGHPEHREDTEPRMTTIDWGKVFKSPQAIVSLLVAVVTTAGTAGLIDTHLSGAIQTLLVAILGVISAVTHVTATAKLTARQARKALQAGESL
jgi:hypothetical protein